LTKTICFVVVFLTVKALRLSPSPKIAVNVVDIFGNDKMTIVAIMAWWEGNRHGENQYAEQENYL